MARFGMCAGGRFAVRGSRLPFIDIGTFHSIADDRPNVAYTQCRTGSHCRGHPRRVGNRDAQGNVQLRHDVHLSSTRSWRQTEHEPVGFDAALRDRHAA